MKTGSALGSAIASICLAQALPAATLVDWLELESAGNPAAFTLLGDDGTAAASGRLIVSGGLSFPGLPSARTLNGTFWEGDSGYENTVSQDATVQAMEFRVAPIDGEASYQIEFEVPSGVPFYLAVGELLQDDLSATVSIGITALSDLAANPPQLEAMVGWDNGFQAFSQNLAWNEDTGTLSPAMEANGQSKVAFFRVDPIEGPNARIRLDVPESYRSGTGDSLTVAVGTVVPEPAMLFLATLGAILLFGRRR